MPPYMRSLIGWDSNLQSKALRKVRLVKDKFIDTRKFETLVHQTVPESLTVKRYGRVK